MASATGLKCGCYDEHTRSLSFDYVSNFHGANDASVVQVFDRCIMRQETIVRTLYKFEELSDKAKQRAMNWYRQASENDFSSVFADYVIEDAKTIGKCLGIRVDDIYYSGFSSRGDGACFNGYYCYAKNSVKELRKYAPVDEELYQIASKLFDLQKHNGYQLQANIQHRGHYYHAECTTIDIDRTDGVPVSEDTEEQLKDLLRDYMRWIYRSLEKEYEYQNSDEVVQENIIANEYEFLEDGKRA